MTTGSETERLIEAATLAEEGDRWTGDRFHERAVHALVAHCRQQSAELAEEKARAVTVAAKQHRAIEEAQASLATERAARERAEELAETRRRERDELQAYVDLCDTRHHEALREIGELRGRAERAERERDEALACVAGSRSPCCNAAVRCGRCGGDTRYDRDAARLIAEAEQRGRDEANDAVAVIAAALRDAIVAGEIVQPLGRRELLVLAGDGAAEARGRYLRTSLAQTRAEVERLRGAADRAGLERLVGNGLVRAEVLVTEQTPNAVAILNGRCAEWRRAAVRTIELLSMDALASASGSSPVYSVPVLPTTDEGNALVDECLKRSSPAKEEP